MRGWRALRCLTLVTTWVVGLAVASCVSDHHVSSWVEPRAILALARPLDVGRVVEKLNRTMAAEGLSEVWRRQGHFASHETFILLDYVGNGALGTKRTAVRLVTPYGVVLALGPNEQTGHHVTLLRAAGAGHLWRSGSDVNGDGRVDVLVRSPDGCIQIWSVDPHGSSPYPVQEGTCPEALEDLDGDGFPEMLSSVEPGEVKDPFVSWSEILGFCHGHYGSDCSSVRNIHRREAERERSRREKLGPAWSRQTTAAYIRLTLQIAWHELSAGLDMDVTKKHINESLKRRPPYDVSQGRAVRRVVDWLWKRFSPMNEPYDS